MSNSETVYSSAISFVIPAHNEENYLPQTLVALHAAAQSCAIEYEVLVVNDASTDNTKQLALQNADRVIDVEIRNIGGVRNAGAAEARYPWLIFLDADTELPAETLKAAIQCLGGGDVGGGAYVDVSREKRIPILKYMVYLSVETFWQTIGGWAAGCFMFCQKSQFEDFGGFNEDYFAAEEWFFSRELKRRGRFRLVRPPVITSARKLHAYSVWQMGRLLFFPLTAGKNFLRSKRGLEMLYEDDR